MVSTYKKLIIYMDRLGQAATIGPLKVLHDQNLIDQGYENREDEEDEDP